MTTRWEEALANGDAQLAAELLQQQLDLCLDVTEKISLLARLAQIHAEDLGDLEAAAETYERLLDLDPSHLPTIQSLEELYQALGQWLQLVDLLELRGDLSTTPSERVELLLRVATLAEECLGDTARACRSYETILLIDPEHPTATRELARLSH